MSRQVRLLETWLGIALFRRTTHSIVLTVAGETYLAAVGQHLAGIAAATERVAATDVGGPLRVRTWTLFAGWLIPPNPSAPDTAPEDLAWTLPRRRHQPARCFSQKLRLTQAAPPFPRSYIHCTKKEGHDLFSQFAARCRACSPPPRRRCPRGRRWSWWTTTSWTCTTSVPRRRRRTGARWGSERLVVCARTPERASAGLWRSW